MALPFSFVVGRRHRVSSVRLRPRRDSQPSLMKLEPIIWRCRPEVRVCMVVSRAFQGAEQALCNRAVGAFETGGRWIGTVCDFKLR
jgi:hypothetical protein